MFPLKRKWAFALSSRVLSTRYSQYLLKKIEEEKPDLAKSKVN